MQILKDDVRLEILRQARVEFISKEFRGASLRAIARKAGMTVGNIYRYFKNKDVLFRELLAPVIGQVEMMKMGMRQHERTPKGSQAETAEHDQITFGIYTFILTHREDLKLLLTGAGGSSLENFEEELILWYAGIYKKALQEAWAQIGKDEFSVHDRTIYLVAQSVADSIIEVIVNEYSLEEVRIVAAEMSAFFEGGTRRILASKNL